jgi:hypothetical protein
LIVHFYFPAPFIVYIMSLSWRTVGSNLELFHSMVSSAKKGNKELDDLLRQAVSLLEANIGGLRAVVGERDAELGTQTVFETLARQATDCGQDLGVAGWSFEGFRRSPQISWN